MQQIALGLPFGDLGTQLLSGAMNFGCKRDSPDVRFRYGLHITQIGQAGIVHLAG